MQEVKDCSEKYWLQDDEPRDTIARQRGASRKESTKSIEKVAQKFQKVADVVGKAGKILGVTSVISNAVDAVNHFRNGDIKSGFISVAKGAIDILLLPVKATPVGVAITIGWAIIFHFWK